jgi:hypothetical protein
VQRFSEKIMLNQKPRAFSSEADPGSRKETRQNNKHLVQRNRSRGTLLTVEKAAPNGNGANRNDGAVSSLQSRAYFRWSMLM